MEGNLIGAMVVGGLGNQMFQYATARALALRRGSGVVLDRTSFRRNFAVNRPYELDRLRTVISPSGPLSSVRFMLARRSLSPLQSISGWKLVRERSLNYDPRIEDLPKRSYLVGYWQCWRYFDDFASTIYDELQPAKPLSPISQSLAEEMSATTSLCIHVRRGDYVTTTAAREHHGVLDIGHYQRAIELIQERIQGLRAFIFSDDLQWCRTAFAPLGLDLTFVDCNRGEDAWQDLFLMAACRHAIIANSSFSWWGAWMGDRRTAARNRMVIAPRRWLAGGDVRFEDHCPPSWIPM